jgi:RNA polymerase sigma factor (sigma-70 family)
VDDAGRLDFEVLYRQLLPFARVVAPRGVDGVDVLQEALTRALARHPNLAGVREPRAYLSRAMVNVARSWARRESRDQARIKGTAGTAPQGAASSDGLGELLGYLAPRQRACLYLRYVEDLSVDDAAERLGCSSGTVKSQTSKALATLRRQLDDEGEHMP